MFGINPELDAFWAGMIFGAILLVYFFITHVGEDGGPERWQRWRAALIMWSSARRERHAAPDMEAVSIPVSGIGMAATGMETETRAAADIDAGNMMKPRVSRNLSNDEVIVLLSLLRGPDGKPRYSANAIYKFVGGDRNTVLALVREVRDGPPSPVFPPLTPEQRDLRKELRLPMR